MNFDPNRVTTVTFDSYSTLVDTDAAERALADRVADPEPVSKLWRSRSLAYTMVANYIDAYQPFYEMNRDALQYSLDAHDVDLPPSERDQILAVYHELDVFDDVRPGIKRIRDEGLECYILSNGNPEMLESLVNHADIGDLITGTISADEVETYKPDAEIYRHAAARTETPIESIAHVGGRWVDVIGASHAGMQAVWVNRAGNPWETFNGEPDLEIESLTELADEMNI